MEEEKKEGLFSQIKNWGNRHKKLIIGIGLGALTLGLGSRLLAKSSDDNYEDSDYDSEDYGGDCTMRFIDDASQEVLGDVPCTMNYAKDMLAISEENK